MNRLTSKWQSPVQKDQTEKVLENYYDRFLKWGSLLTRGDAGKAEEIVQDLCLHLTLTKPDLSGIANLDGYLYTCLRHLYLSALARSSREVLQFVGTAEFDSAEFALAAHSSGDLLEKQNDLLRICRYSVWRKEHSKSFSYFILHFFHGYFRQEIADLARLPISAIYNKLKQARDEIKLYLEEPKKLHIAHRDLPPEADSLWRPVSSPELFKTLREIILAARASECLAEEKLLEYYSDATLKPIPCSLLSHIVSCEKCLSIIDRHFRRPTLSDREPLDGSGSASTDKAETAANMSRKALLGSLRKRRERIYEHCPRMLSIAVNGKIVALHDVQGQRSILSARIDRPEDAQFIEVFSEQDVRLAFLPIGNLPPEGPHLQTQRIALSNDRWLELNLAFDGMGLNSEVAYFDPALGLEAPEEESEENPALSLMKDSPQPSGISSRSKVATIFAIAARFWMMVPSSAMVWALLLVCVFGTTGYLLYRHAQRPLEAKQVLNQSIKIETASLKGQTKHQVLRFEETAADGHLLQEGTIDLWKDGDDSRYLRRLYDAQNRLIAAEWRKKNGEHRSFMMEGGTESSGNPLLDTVKESWTQDVSAYAFSRLAEKEPTVHVNKDGYALEVDSPIENHPQLVSATLVLDRRFLPVREVLRIRMGTQVHEVRLVQTSYERKLTSSVPDATFEPGDQSPHSFNDRLVPSSPIQRRGLLAGGESDVRLAQLHIAVLYQLSQLGADTSDPIEVIRTSDGRIRVSGTIANDARRRELHSHLEALADHQLLDLRLISPGDLRMHASDPRSVMLENKSIYNSGQTKPPADAILHRYFQKKGLSGEPLNSAVVQFSHDALQHAQNALQHAYALNRLGGVFFSVRLDTIGSASQQQWTEMVYKHSSALQVQLRALNEQIAQISAIEGQSQRTDSRLIQIENLDQLTSATDRLLRQVRDLNHNVGVAFASGLSEGAEQDPESLPGIGTPSIPLAEANEIAGFANRLESSMQSATFHGQRNSETTNRPR